MVRLGAPDEKGLMIHPTRTPGITEGYGTLVDEIFLDQPDTDVVVIPFGVGGLSIGIAQRIKLLKPDTTVYTCEPETAAPLSASLKSGRPTSIQGELHLWMPLGDLKYYLKCLRFLHPLLTPASLWNKKL